MRSNACSGWVFQMGDHLETIEIAFTVIQRLRGMLFRAPDEVTRLLIPCCDIHTFGMQHPIDVAFIGKDGGVLEVYRNVGRMQRLKHKHASMVAERFSRKGTWLCAGDVLRLGSQRMVHI